MITKDFDPPFWYPYFFIRRAILRGIKQNAPLLKGKLLDFGCGSKPYRSLFEVEEYLGVDFENEGHSHENEEIDIYYDGQQLPFERDHFDSILCSEVFEHVFNLPDILSELNRVLKPGGKMLVTCPFVWKEHEVPHDYARYTLFALEDLFQKKGFRVIVKGKGGNFAETLAQLTVLFLHDTVYGKVARIPIVKHLGIFFLMVIPNLCGRFLSKIFHRKNQLYLSNIIVAEKV